jgi:probable HAF family extracellular repeat protein
LTNGGSVVINEHNVVVGAADTATSCPFFPDAFVSIPFKWSNGATTKLPLLPGGCSGFPIAINEHGVIVGVADDGVIDPATGSPEIHAVVWRGTTITDLGTFGGANSLAGAVNDRGQITGVAQNAEPDLFNFGNLIGLPSSTQWRGFLWEDGVMRDLGTLGGPDAAVTGDLALNERGQIAGISFTDEVINPVTGVPTLDSFLWNDGFVDLGTLGGTFTNAFTINNRGQVSGYSDVAGDLEAHAFRWSKGRLQDLGTLGGFAGGGWINDAGVVIGASTTPGDTAVRGVIWRGRGIEELGALDGDDCSDAFVVNAKSQVIGPSFSCNGNESSGYLWDDGVLLDLNAFVPPTSKLHVIVSKYINDRGMITGAGVLPNGDEHAVLFIPCNDNGHDCRGGSQGVRAGATGRRVSSPRELPPAQTLGEIESGFINRRVARQRIAGSARLSK